jgi:hypothetical protein
MPPSSKLETRLQAAGAEIGDGFITFVAWPDKQLELPAAGAVTEPSHKHGPGSYRLQLVHARPVSAACQILAAALHFPFPVSHVKKWNWMDHPDFLA